MPALKQWTKEEEQAFADAWMSEMPTRDILRMFRVYEQTARKKARMMGMPGRRSWVVEHKRFGRYKQACELKHKDYVGPAGWYCDQGPPCSMCEYDDNKTPPGCEFGIREECRLCRARVIWDEYNAIPDLERRSFLPPAV